MKVTGIIAEFNPFHNGHRYLIGQAREITGADYCIAVMSGSFVQRGAPALEDKYTRTQCALENGIDLVLELPEIFVCRNAESFAGSGVGILNGLGVVTDLAFGCEADPSEQDLLVTLSELFSAEPEGFRRLLASYIKSGMSYPAARSRAAVDFLCSESTEGKKSGDPPVSKEAGAIRLTAAGNRKESGKEQLLSTGKSEIAEPEKVHAFRNFPKENADSVRKVLESPNNVLAIEYLKALHLFHSSIRPCMVQRHGSGHHTERLEFSRNGHPSYASASAIRSCILTDSLNPFDINGGDYVPSLSHEESRTSGFSILKHFMPETAFSVLLRQKSEGLLLQENDFSSLLHYKLLQTLNPALTGKDSVPGDMLLRIRNQLEAFTDWDSFASLVKSRNVTLTAVNRQFTRLLLDIRNDTGTACVLHAAPAGKNGPAAAEPPGLPYAPYARILGFRKDAAPLLKKIRQKGCIPAVTSASNALKRLPAVSAGILEKDVCASDIRNCILTEKTGKARANDLRHPLVII